MNPAQHARLQKELHPDRYCAHKNCLWNVARSGPCRNHSPAEAEARRLERLAEREGDLRDMTADLLDRP